MLNTHDHLDNLIRHIELVREATTLLGKRLISKGRIEFGRLLIAKGFEHDVSKFYGIEFDYLHAGKDTPKEELDLAVKQHIRTNSHHPEYWGGFENMPELAIAEMVCDWYARSQEFGTSVRDWILESAIEKFKIDTDGSEYALVNKFLDILLEDNFVR
jgi:hypothetical protein